MHHITGAVRSRRSSAAYDSSNRSSRDDSEVTNGDDVEVVEPEQGNVLSHIISQLRPGADLSRVVLPTFILEPRSMLERITNFMAHPETLLPMPEIDDPVQRFVSVVKFYLSGWHIKPPGVKKPLNPILGETFTCYWEFPDKTRGYYISEQTSHHPPKSSYFYMAPEHHIRIDGTLKPRSKFLGNSAASMMEGVAYLRLMNRGKSPGGERYLLTQPNMYARGILFGKMKYELGDHSYVRCPELGLSADIEFKTKGWVGGTYNAIAGTIKNDAGQTLFEIGGMWTGEMTIKDMTTGKKSVLFDASTARSTPPIVRPLEEQDERESQKLWHKTAEAVKARNHEVATDEKTKIEDMQRDEAAKRSAQGVEWVPRLFRPVKGGRGGPEEGEEDLDWILDANIDGNTPQKQVEQILAITPILIGQKSNEKNAIPKRESLDKGRPAEPQQPAAAPPAQPPTQPAPSQPPAAPQPDANAVSQRRLDTSENTPPKVPQPADLVQAQTANGGQAQTELERTLAQTATAQKQGPLLDFSGDLKRSLPRQDASDDDDEFVDAQG